MQRERHLSKSYKKPLFDVYNALVMEEETLTASLDSSLHEYDAETCLKMSLNQDLMAQRTTSGIHKSDLTVGFKQCFGQKIWITRSN